MNEQINLIPNEQLGELQKIALSKALAMLRAADAKYIVVLPGGTEIAHGDLKLAPPETKITRKRVVPIGTYKKIYDPILRGMQVGQIVKIPYDGHDKHGLQSACTAWCSSNWGKGSALSHMTADALEVIRIA